MSGQHIGAVLGLVVDGRVIASTFLSLLMSQ